MSIESRRSSAESTDPLKKLPPELHRACIRVRGLLAIADAHEVRAKYAVGLLLLKLINGRAPYGTKVVVKIASALKVHRSTLYDCKSVAEAWTRQELRSVLAQRTSTGLQAFRWSHLVTLAAVKNTPERAARMQEVVAHGLTNDQLRTRMSKLSNPDVAQPRDGMWVRTLQQMNAHAEAAASAERWRLQLAKVCDAPLHRLLPVLRSSLAGQLRFREECTATIELLADAIREAERRLAEATLPSDYGEETTPPPGP